MSVVIQAASSGVNWSAIITGIVGVAGISGTLAAVRMAARAEDKRAQRAEKRDIYARFLTAESSATWVFIRYLNRKGNLSLLGDTPHEVLNAAIGELTQAQSTLRLIAPDDTPEDVGPLAGRLLTYQLSHIRDTLSGPDITESFSPEYGEIRLALLDAMRTDLGLCATNSKRWLGLLGQDPKL